MTLTFPGSKSWRSYSDTAKKEDFLRFGAQALEAICGVLPIELGASSDGDFSEVGHGFGFLWRTELLFPAVHNHCEQAKERGENIRLGMKEMLDILGGKD